MILFGMEIIVDLNHKEQTRGGMLLGLVGMMAGVVGMLLFLGFWLAGWFAWYLPVISAVAFFGGLALFIITPIRRMNIRSGRTPKREQLMQLTDEGIKTQYREYPKDGSDVLVGEMILLPWDIIAGVKSKTRATVIKYGHQENLQNIIIPVDNIQDYQKFKDLMRAKLDTKMKDKL